MIGLKIALTGLILLMFSAMVIKCYGEKMPSFPIILLMVVMCFGGLASFVGGLIYSIWS